MNQSEKLAVNQVCDYIESLASMENCCFEESIKEDMACYMRWFDSAAYFLRALAEADDSFDRRLAVEDILRYCK